MTHEEFSEAARQRCQFCRDGVALRYRPDSEEFVHEWHNGPSFSLTICRANQLRKEHPEFR